jgi:hypothetical protein
MSSERPDLHRFAFWTILTFAAVVRLKGLSSGLPLHTLYGESDTFLVLERMLYTGNLNPHPFIYPGLSYYIHLPFLYLFYWIGVWAGYFNDIASIPQASLIFVGRFVCAMLGTATVVLVHKLGLNFGKVTALTAMAILAAIPQHIEFSHMLRPEVPAVFFVVAAHLAAFSLIQKPTAAKVLLMGVLAGAAFSIKFNIGLPLIFTVGFALWFNKKALPLSAFLLAPLGFLAIFIATNPFLIADPSTLFHWLRKMDAFYSPAEDYYGKNVVYFYIEYLTRYNYQLPLIILSVAGFVFTLSRYKSKGLLLSIYPMVLFLWLCSYDVRRVHELLPLHPFIGIWSGILFEFLWKAARQIPRSQVVTVGYLVVISFSLFFPYQRALTQVHLYSRVDNRSKAELWMVNHLPQGSKIALLQFHQIELDPGYFEVESFTPRDYVGKKDFRWFVKENFDYVVVSSGQYMRYYTEGPDAKKFKDYFETFFAQAPTEGTLMLDLVTHPTLIPDYRIKVYSTKRAHVRPGFIQAVIKEDQNDQYELNKSGSALSLPPGYYSLKLPEERDPNNYISVRNLKLNETILQKSSMSALSASEKGSEFFPFAILPVRLNARFSLFSHTQPDITPNQHVQFNWKGIPDGIQVSEIRPPLEILSVRLDANTSVPESSSSLELYDKSGSSLRRKPVRAEQFQPFLLFDKDSPLIVECELINRSRRKVTGHVEAFLSDVGESQPWKSYQIGSDMQEFVVEAGHEIPIEIPLNTNALAGDYELSFWIFTRQDIPFTPQNGGWFNKQIRIRDPRLGVHPIYRIPIP